MEEHLQSKGGRSDIECVGEGAVVQSYSSVLKSGPPPTNKPVEARSPTTNYWNCRRALHIIPLEEGDGPLAVQRFRQEEQFIQDLGPVHVQRIPFGLGAKIKKEAVVSFATIDARDAVKGAAKNLAGKVQEYGIRHEVPNHLKTNLKALHTLSYNIKQRHPDARRNVLFDDSVLDLALDACLEEEGQWRRISSAQARSKAKGKASTKIPVDDGELDAILDASH